MPGAYLEGKRVCSVLSMAFPRHWYPLQWVNFGERQPCTQDVVHMCQDELMSVRHGLGIDLRAATHYHFIMARITRES